MVPESMVGYNYLRYDEVLMHSLASFQKHDTIVYVTYHQYVLQTPAPSFPNYCFSMRNFHSPSPST